MQAAKNDIDINTRKGLSIELVLDHLVDALGGEPSCPLRRALVLVDIDEHPHTTQAEIMERLDVPKSALNRDIDWMHDYGCIYRDNNVADGREIELITCGYAKKNLDFALNYFDFSHENLKNMLGGFINLFGEKKPTLRDAKIVTVIGNRKAITRQQLFEKLFNGPVTTDNRAVNNLINFGLVQKDDE